MDNKEIKLYLEENGFTFNKEFAESIQRYRNLTGYERDVFQENVYSNMSQKEKFLQWIYFNNFNLAKIQDILHKDIDEAFVSIVYFFPKESWLKYDFQITESYSSSISFIFYNENDIKSFLDKAMPFLNQMPELVRKNNSESFFLSNVSEETITFTNFADNNLLIKISNDKGPYYT